ncbi:MAG: hypothetical protein CM15mP117_02720 [Alphaproteobacteria bacterium]|nr:MAG: hypothetical protein CM15mP117_02720 [Alphaproteobacteria bacterium]
MHSKLQTLTHLCNKQNISVKDAAAIGDGANDLEMLKVAGLGVAFNGKPILKKEIKTQLNHTDLVGLLFYKDMTLVKYIDEAVTINIFVYLF